MFFYSYGQFICIGLNFVPTFLLIFTIFLRFFVLRNPSLSWWPSPLIWVNLEEIITLASWKFGSLFARTAWRRSLAQERLDVWSPSLDFIRVPFRPSNWLPCARHFVPKPLTQQPVVIVVYYNQTIYRNKYPSIITIIRDHIYQRLSKILDLFRLCPPA